jgi:hypothetical protein
LEGEGDPYIVVKFSFVEPKILFLFPTSRPSSKPLFAFAFDSSLPSLDPNLPESVTSFSNKSLNNTALSHSPAYTSNASANTFRASFCLTIPTKLPSNSFIIFYLFSALTSFMILQTKNLE